MPSQVFAKLIKKEKLLEGLYKFSVEAKEIVDIAKPGNFVEIKVNENLDPFLRRPISIYNLDKDKMFSVIIKGDYDPSKKVSNSDFDEDFDF